MREFRYNPFGCLEPYQHRTLQWSRLCIRCYNGSGKIQWCWCTGRSDTDPASPGIRWCLWKRRHFHLSLQFHLSSLRIFQLMRYCCFISLSSPRPSVVKPGPRGHIFLYCTVPGRGQSSHCGPQPRPILQQHSDLVTLFLLVDDCWHMVRRTSV